MSPSEADCVCLLAVVFPTLLRVLYPTQCRPCLIVVDVVGRCWWYEVSMKLMKLIRLMRLMMVVVGVDSGGSRC